MSNEMRRFLDELRVLLEAHKVGFVRSANNTHDLVISLHNGSGGFEDLHCEEELCADDIKFERFKFNKAKGE